MLRRCAVRPRVAQNATGVELPLRMAWPCLARAARAAHVGTCDISDMAACAYEDARAGMRAGCTRTLRPFAEGDRTCPQMH